MKFRDNLIKKFRCLFDFVVIEKQPLIRQVDEEKKLLNFKLQALFASLTGTLTGMGIEYFEVLPATYRRHFGLTPGSNQHNKAENTDFVERVYGLHFSEVTFAKRNHVADSVLMGIFYLERVSKKQVRKSTDDKPLQNSYESAAKKRCKHGPRTKVCQSFQNNGKPD